MLLVIQTVYVQVCISTGTKNKNRKCKNSLPSYCNYFVEVCDACILLYDSVNVLLSLIDVTSTPEPVLLRVKRPDSTAKPVKPLTLDNDDKSKIVLPSETPVDQTEKAPEIKVSLERINPGPSSSSQGEGKGNDLSPKKLRDRVEEAMFSELCSLQEYTQMKAEVLRYHCVRFQEKDCSPQALYSSE